MQSNNYEKDIQKHKQKLENLEKILISEKKELDRLKISLKSAKQRSKIALNKSKSSNKKAISKHAKLTINKETEISKSVDLKSKKIKRLRESIQEIKAEIKNISEGKKQYTSAKKDFDKQWDKFYTKPQLANDDLNIGATQQANFSNQVRASRALLNLSVNEFSKLLDITPEMVKKIEQPISKSIFELKLINSIHKKLESAGIQLIPNGFYIGDGGVGVRLKKSSPVVKNTKSNKRKKEATVVRLKKKKGSSKKRIKKVA